jgi:hypothetical protein
MKNYSHKMTSSKLVQSHWQEWPGLFSVLLILSNERMGKKEEDEARLSETRE